MLLLTPGPTRVPERVLRAGARPMIHHRTPEFSKELAVILELLPPLFGTTQPVLPINATGRGSMEASLCNLFSPGEAIGVSCNGRFGELWVKLAKAQGLVVHRIATGWDDNLAPGDVERLLSEHPEIRGFAMAYGDTSTAVANDVAGVARVTRARDVMLLVDGVSSIGGMPFEFDEWGVDVAVTASQKCLMSSPGISFAVLSERARARQSRATLVHTYWDFAEIHKDVTKPKPEPPGTPPIHCVMQVGEALRMIHEEGLAGVYQRHAAMASMTHAAMADLGLRHQCPSLTGRSATVTAIALPPEYSPANVRDGLKARGFLTAGALEHFQPTAFRIGHMGDIRPTDLAPALAALKDVLKQ